MKRAQLFLRYTSAGMNREWNVDSVLPRDKKKIHKSRILFHFFCCCYSALTVVTSETTLFNYICNRKSGIFLSAALIALTCVGEKIYILIKYLNKKFIYIFFYYSWNVGFHSSDLTCFGLNKYTLLKHTWHFPFGSWRIVIFLVEYLVAEWGSVQVPVIQSSS